MSKGKVIQDWMGELSWKQQSVILSSLRGPDLSRPVAVKKLNRWLRGITQNNADPSTEYMKEIILPDIEDLKEEVGYCTMHYFTHLMHALEIIGYKHPDKSVREIGEKYYLGLVDFVHLNPETANQMEKRLEDKV
jgi:hypothetical protein